MALRRVCRYPASTQAFKPKSVNWELNDAKGSFPKANNESDLLLEASLLVRIQRY